MLLSRRAVIELRSTYGEQSDEVANAKNESISNIDLVRQYEIARYTKRTLKAQLATDTLSMASSLTYSAQDLVMETGILVGALLVGRKDVGAFVTYTAYMSQIMSNGFVPH